ncbi:hypothetical protein [uncultured Pseudodesulfovibrio sp.]|uniref:hypothetical protein n=1 Tax=uncultured Pseudodesulfovibrio sp. TaxID=2035858 RepID=UPI0029C8D628|nr:hypothetical protein [uncultured Pseudodesulfovibrio sp.]
MSSAEQSGYRTSFDEDHGVEPVLHAIDYEDVALTHEGARLVQIGAQAVMRQFMPGMDFENLTQAQAVALFVDRLFWEEHSGGLIMCTDVADKSVCLPIPSKHWTVRRDQLGTLQ